MIKIATDSTCDLPGEYYQTYDITVVPINIQFGTETYEDGVTIDRLTFLRKIERIGHPAYHGAALASAIPAILRRSG